MNAMAREWVGESIGGEDEYAETSPNCMRLDSPS